MLAEAELCARVVLVPVTRRLPPCAGIRVEDADEMVSSELVPISDGAADVAIGAGGVSGSDVISAGARRPFLVVLAARELGMWKRFLALGADATRRMNRAAALVFLSVFASKR